jgi:hypothetical protein
MRRLGAVAVVAGALLGAPGGAQAADPPPGAAISDNLEYVTRVAGANGIVEGKFDRVKGKDVLVVTGRFGFKTYDVSDPEDPQLLDEFIPDELADFGYWQNEDMELDTQRKLIIGSLDPRHTEKDQTRCPGDNNVTGPKLVNPLCKAGFYVISYANPAGLEQIGDFVELPAGHTTSCIQKCRYLWTGGPARSAVLTQGAPRTYNPALRWLGPILGPTEVDPNFRFERAVGDGRPIWVTDFTNPAKPQVSDEPIDLWRNDGYTDYSHDVDEDAQGIAWISGRGGIRGYATSGVHRDPYQNRTRRATPFDPILVAGGGVGGTAQAAMFMHNSGRPTDGSVRASGVKKGNVLVGTEEDFTRPCEASGKIVLSDITDSLGGEPASKSTLDDPYRMKPLDTFHPFVDTPETAAPDLECSAHYFEIEGPMLGAAWYGQGLRLLDIGDARDVRQVGYYRVKGAVGDTANPSSSSWDVAFRSDRHAGDLVYLFDMARGIEVIRIKKGAQAAGRMKSVTAPSLGRDPAAARPVGSLDRSVNGDGSVSYVCPLLQ